MMSMIEHIQQACNRGCGGKELRGIINAKKGESEIIWSVTAGQCKGTTHGRTVVTGTYSTMNWGELQTYSVSSAAVGDLIEYEGEQWRVIVNRSTQGDAHMPSHNWFVAVKEVAA
jgi:hypothetical protein